MKMRKSRTLWAGDQKYLVGARRLSWLRLLPLSPGEREAGVGQKIPGWGACGRLRRRARAARGGAGHRGRAPRPDRPLNPPCSAASGCTPASRPSHSTTSPPSPSESCGTTAAPRCLRASLWGSRSIICSRLLCKATASSGVLSASLRLSPVKHPLAAGSALWHKVIAGLGRDVGGAGVILSAVQRCPLFLQLGIVPLLAISWGHLVMLT